MDLMQLPEVLCCNPSLVDGIEKGSTLELGRSWLRMARKTRLPRVPGGSWTAWSKVKYRVAQGGVARDYAWDVARTKGGLEDDRMAGCANPKLVATVRLGRVTSDSSRAIDR